MKLITVKTVQGLNLANLVKSKLESYGVPVLLKYESVGAVFGLTLDGLGKVDVMVPEDYRELAQELLKEEEASSFE